MNRDKFWTRVFGIGFILIVASFCISMLMTPIMLRGGVYTRIGEIQKQHLKTLEILEKIFSDQLQAHTKHLEATFYQKLFHHVHERHMNDKAIFVDKNGETTIYY